MTDLKVLLVSYVFPPLGGTGVMRAASLARYFSAEGIRLDVLTARNASAVGADPTLLKEIPTEVTVHRTLTLDLPFGIKKGIKRLITGSKPPDGKTGGYAAGKPNFLKRALENVLLPDPQVTWFPVLKRATRRIVRERNIDLVLITAPPFSNLLLVEGLRKEFPVWLSLSTSVTNGSRPLLISSAFSSAVASAPAASPATSKQAPLRMPPPLLQ